MSCHKKKSLTLEASGDSVNVLAEAQNWLNDSTKTIPIPLRIFLCEALQELTLLASKHPDYVRGFPKSSPLLLYKNLVRIDQAEGVSNG